MTTSKIIACLILICCVYSLEAQDTIKRNMINSAKITLVSNSSFHSKGALYQVNDSSIMLSNSFNVDSYTLGNSNFSLTEIDVIDIQLIKIKSKKRTRKSALIGAATGIVVGLIWGIAENSSSSYYYIGEDWWSPTGGAIIGGSMGAAAGALIGSIGINIPINGSMNKYKSNKAKLMKYALKK